LTLVIVQPGNEYGITLEPEYITPHDETQKHDCEIEAASVNRINIMISTPKQSDTIFGDDLFRRQPYCQKLKDKKLHLNLGVRLICISLVRNG
jgi:hypothetical protein